MRNKCPSCNQGQVFIGLFKMNPACPSCGFKFERESGYFYGAMFIQYMIMGLFILITMIIGWLAQLSEFKIGIICLLEIILVSPFLFRISRLVWMKMDYRSDPEKKS